MIAIRALAAASATPYFSVSLTMYSFERQLSLLIIAMRFNFPVVSLEVGMLVILLWMISNSD